MEMEMEKGQRVEIKIKDMTSAGQGLGKSNGLAIFVDGAVIGDTIIAELTKVKKNYAFGQLIEILKPSKVRIEAQCEHFGQCGGCPYGELSYEAQLQVKEKQVRDALTRLGGLTDPLVNPIIGMNDPVRYRNKASMPIWTGGIITRKGGVMENLGKPTIGFFKAKSHEVTNCYDCMLQSAPAMAAAEAVRQFMQEDNITAYDPKWEKGLMRHLIVKTAKGTGEVMVILVVNGKGIPNAEKLVEMLNDAIYNLPTEGGTPKYQLESVIVNTNKKKNSETMGETSIAIAGKQTILEEAGGLKFEISPRSFYQVNPAQMEVLYDKAVHYAALSGTETVLDLYCGVGTIGLFAAKSGAGSVIGIESVKTSVVDANRNAIINGIVNARYICGRAEEELPKLISGEEMKDQTMKIDGADVVILDPPRAGCDERLLNAVVAVGPKRIVYVSCDPATLSRDIKFLTDKGYNFKEATPVDMFPWTGHVEAVTLLTRQNGV